MPPQQRIVVMILKAFAAGKSFMIVTEFQYLGCNLNVFHFSLGTPKEPMLYYFFLILINLVQRGKRFLY